MDVLVQKPDENMDFFRRQMDGAKACFALMSSVEQENAVHVFHCTEHVLLTSAHNPIPTSYINSKHDECCNSILPALAMQRLSNMEKENRLLKENLWNSWHVNNTSCEKSTKKEQPEDVVKHILGNLVSKIDFFREIHLTQKSLDKYTHIETTSIIETPKKPGRSRKKKTDDENISKPKKRKNPFPQKVIKEMDDAQEDDNAIASPVRKSRRKAAMKSNVRLELLLDEDDNTDRAVQEKEISTKLPKKDIKSNRVEKKPIKTKRLLNDVKPKKRERRDPSNRNKTGNKVQTNEPECSDKQTISKEVEKSRQDDTSTHGNIVLAEQTSQLNQLSTVDFEPQATGKRKSAESLPYNCFECSVSFASETSLKRHLKTKHSPGKNEAQSKTFMCDDCPDESFKSELATWFHYNEKHAQDGDLRACLMCGERMSEEGMKTHIKLHYPSANFSCKDCAMMFPMKEDYDSHTEEHAKGVYRCSWCKVKFGSALILSKHCHSTTHQLKTGQKPLDKKHLCAQCGRSYFRKHALVRHMRYHTGEKPFKCPHCEYWCREDTNLKLHIALHFSRRDFVCDSCGSAFHQKKTLERHILYKHSDARNFTCPHCSKSFKTRYGMSRHESVHKSERNFRCNECGAGFKRAYNLRHHMVTIHSVEADLYPPAHSVKVLDIPEGEVEVKGSKRIKQNRKSKKSAPNGTILTQTNPENPQTEHIPQLDPTQDWQKLQENGPGSFQVFLGSQLDTQEIAGGGAYVTSILPQNNSISTTLGQDLIPSMEMPQNTNPSALPTLDLQQQHQEIHVQQQQQQLQQQQQQQQQLQQHQLQLQHPHQQLQYLTLQQPTLEQQNQTLPPQSQPMLVDKQYQETTYPYYLLPTVNQQQETLPPS